jgi:hypothetical protein
MKNKFQTKTLLTSHYSLNTTHFSLLTKHFSLLTSHFSLPSWLILLLLISCQSTPITSDTIFEKMEYVPLDDNGFAYIFTNVKEARPILDILPVQQLKNWQANLILENTEMAAAALFSKESGRRFQVAGWGNYPSFRASIALFFNTTWKRQRTAKGAYWSSAVQKLSVVINPKQVFAVAWHDTHINPVPVSPGVRMPEGFTQFMQGAALSCWMDSPALILNQILANEGIPVNLPAEQLFLNLNPKDGNQYEVLIRLRFFNAAQARTIAGVLALANVFSVNQKSLMASLFFANPPVLNGRYIDIKTALLSEKEITLLLQMFLLYWK